MNRSLPPFPALRAFEAAARLQSFRRAAEELHVTASAISHQVRRLEDFLGVRLFLRDPGGTTPTVAGRDYLASVGGLLDALAECTARARGQGDDALIRLRTTPAFAARWLLPRLRELRAEHPELELQITTSVDAVDFRSEPVDLVVQYGDEEGPGMFVQPLMTSVRVPVCAPALLLGDSAPRVPSDLRRQVLMRDMVGDGWDEWFEHAGLDGPAPPGPRFEHCELSLCAAEQGQGVALAYLALVSGELEDGSLVRLFAEQTASRVIYTTALPAAGANPEGVSTLLRWLMRHVGVDREALPRAGATPAAPAGRASTS